MSCRLLAPLVRESAGRGNDAVRDAASVARSMAARGASTHAGPNCAPARSSSSATATVPVRSVRGHRLERVGDEDEPRLELHLITAEPGWIAASVEVLVMWST